MDQASPYARNDCDCVLCRVRPVDGQHRPKALPTDATCNPPVPCDFVVGDEVIYTNDYGLKFNLRVRGFAPEVWEDGRFIYVFTECWWMPVRPQSLRKKEDMQ